MNLELADLYRQHRLAHVVEHVALWQGEQFLTAELDGRHRAKLGKLVQQAGFSHIRRLKVISKTISHFQMEVVKR